MSKNKKKIVLFVHTVTMVIQIILFSTAIYRILTREEPQEEE